MRPIEYTRAQSNNWHCAIESLKGVNFNLFDFTLPMISIGTTELGTGGDRNLILPGTSLDIDQIQLNFFVEESFRNYIEIYFWMRHNLNLNQPIQRDITISPLNSMKEYQGVAFVYKGCHPINMAPIPYDSSGETSDILMGLTLVVEDIEVRTDWIDTETNPITNLSRE